MIAILTLLVTAAVAYALVREGLLTAVTMLVNVVLAGLVAFNFYEPISDELEKMLVGTFLEKTEDALVLTLLFTGALGVLRVATNNLANQELDLPALPQQIATALVGAVTGYLLAGFLTCMVSTLPLPEKFLGYEAADESPLRRYLPADRVWLGMMYHAGAGPFSQGQATPEGLPATLPATHDPEGSFPLRYARLRRVKDEP